MSGFFSELLRVHLVFALGAASTFWVAACARKGGPFHRAAGRWFSLLIYAAAITGGAIAVAQLVSPSFVRPPEPGVPTETALAAARLTRQTMWLVLYVLVIIVAPVQHGLAAIAAGPEPFRMRSWQHALLSLLAIAGSLLILPAAVSWQQWTYLIVSPIGFVVGLRDLTYAGRRQATPRDWQREHLTSLLTAGITLHTVFLVFGLSRTLHLTLDGWSALAPWTLPALIGLPVVVWLRARWKGEVFRR